MKEQRISYGTEDKRSVLQIHVYTAIAFLVRNIWTHTPSASGSYSRQADEIQVDFETMNILYRLNYLDFYFVDISAMLLIPLEVYFRQFFSNKVRFRACLEVHKIQLPFFHVDP